MLLILSSPNAHIKRDAIREGWLAELGQLAKYRKFRFKHAFIVGINGPKEVDSFAVRQESELQGDMLLLPLVDGYWNLSLKIAMMFQQTRVRHSQCKFIFKIDDDVYVRPRRLIAMIRRLPNFPLYGGYMYDQRKRRMAVVRNVTDKFSFTREEFPNMYFEPYAR